MSQPALAYRVLASQNSLQLLSVNKLFKVDHTLIIISRWNKAHQHHQSAWPARNSQTAVKFKFIFALVFWVVDDAWNWV